jgi:hemolysin D
MKLDSSVPVPVSGRPLQAAERAFLPAALEVVETPPSPIGRAITWTIVLLFCIALTWASIGQIDIVASAPGKIVPSVRNKIIQPFETGVVRAIHVQDGQHVQVEQVLIEIDPTINAAERDRVAKELLSHQLDIARLQAALRGAEGSAKFAPPVGASSEQVELQNAFLSNQLSEYRAKIVNLDRQIAQHEASKLMVEETVEKLTQIVPLAEQRVEARKTLADKGFAVLLNYIQDKMELIDKKQELRVQQAHLVQVTNEIAALQAQREQADAEFRRTNLSDLAQAEQKAAGLREVVAQADQRRQLQTLVAPVDGTVQQLAVHTIGGVVTVAQQLMVIVPADSQLEAEAMISNRDIGFVHPGQQAEIKVDTFNFTRYGLLHGVVQNVSQDAIVPETGDKEKMLRTGAAPANSSAPQGQDLAFAARVSLDSIQMQVEDKVVNLGPGMAVTVEIKTGSRRVIEYLLSPLLRYRQESLRER